MKHRPPRTALVEAMVKERDMPDGCESQALRAEYDALKERGARLLAQGDLEKALETLEEALETASDLDDPDLADIAYCNRSAVAMRLRRPGDAVGQLQEVLLRTQNPHVATLAAYNLACEYDRRKDFKKVVFYGRIAAKYAEDGGFTDLQASALNELGNAFAGLNQFQVALEHYRRGLALLGPEPGHQKAHLLNNIGYVSIVLGSMHEAFGSAFRSLRMFRACGLEALYACESHLTLAFAYLHVGRPDSAQRHAFRALDHAERSLDVDRLKYALLFLGESHKLLGDEAAARDYFSLLQESFYPDMPEVPGMLFALDVCKLINLKA